MPIWLEHRDVDFFYRELMSQFGGLAGHPNEEVLAATLARPRQQLAYEPDSSLFDLAASYGFGFARNHCFPDGNKRIALATMDVFLTLNAHDLAADEAETVVVINAVAVGEYSQSDLSAWLQQNCSEVADNG